MKVRTINRFREKDNFSVIHEVGSEFECTNERGTYLQQLGFVEIVREKQPEAEEPSTEDNQEASVENVEPSTEDNKGKPFAEYSKKGDEGESFETYEETHAKKGKK